MRKKRMRPLTKGKRLFLLILTAALAALCIGGFSIVRIHEDDMAEQLADGIPDGRLVISALGDSITYGTKTRKPYEYYLGEMLRADQVNNYGVPYTDLSASAGGSQPFLSRYHKIRSDSDLIFVLGGTNDWWHGVPLGTIKDTTDISFYGGVYQLMTRLKERYPKARIVFATPLKRIRDGAPTMRNRNGDQLRDFARAIKQEGVKNNIQIIDLYHARSCDFTGDQHYRHYWTDGLHPNARGDRRIARVVYRNLMPLTSEKTVLSSLHTEKQKMKHETRAERKTRGKAPRKTPTALFSFKVIHGQEDDAPDYFRP
ncbi:MAG: SGNH/GDSL hydrolase family protein [Eubacteriales bacterium]|nr:SGNH/GDSL hydrolase family protein [Eubacteriales bacterium]